MECNTGTAVEKTVKTPEFLVIKLCSLSYIHDERREQRAVMNKNKRSVHLRLSEILFPERKSIIYGLLKSLSKFDMLIFAR